MGLFCRSISISVCYVDDVWLVFILIGLVTYVLFDLIGSYGDGFWILNLTVFLNSSIKQLYYSYSPFRGSIDRVTIAWGKTLIFDISSLLFDTFPFFAKLFIFPSKFQKTTWRFWRENKIYFANEEGMKEKTVWISHNFLHSSQ
jgi:hypothetical protein